ncbi:hypothetical protein RRG08_034144 [Elysia crispata]|uniref:Uncharacterized protein n=1 Tax=Elysia crispata TaxID=231223 RepID=A0AAE0ZKE4_9GAST|nr:hypothetical protein RRG08_034144 [Elysia crispata]
MRAEFSQVVRHPVSNGLSLSTAGIGLVPQLVSSKGEDEELSYEELEAFSKTNFFLLKVLLAMVLLWKSKGEVPPGRPGWTRVTVRAPGRPARPDVDPLTWNRKPSHEGWNTGGMPSE